MFDSTTTIEESITTQSTSPKVENEGDRIDRRLRGYARHRSALDAAEAFDLLRAEQLRIFLFFGCVTLWEYMERELGYTPHAARERMRVARALATLPATTSEFWSGDRRYSAVRGLTRIATADTERVWLDATRGMTGAQIEDAVAGRAVGDLPTDPKRPNLRKRKVTIELPPEVYALFREARRVLEEERGGEVSDAELYEVMCRRVIEPGTGAAGPAHQIAYKQCADCKRATQNGAGREIDIPSEVIDRAHCDSTNLGSLDALVPEKITASVTPRLRKQIFARDQHRCSVPGCRSARNLEVHHVIEQSRGGPHCASNLTLLCSGHHAAHHAGRLMIEGEAPSFRYRWTYKPLAPGLADDVRRAMHDEQCAALLESILERHRLPHPDRVAWERIHGTDGS